MPPTLNENHDVTGQSAASSMLDRLEDPNTYGALVSSLLATMQAFGTSAGPQGVAIATLSYALLQIFHPSPHTVPVPLNLQTAGMGPITNAP